MIVYLICGEIGPKEKEYDNNAFIAQHLQKKMDPIVMHDKDKKDLEKQANKCSQFLSWRIQISMNV